MKRYEHDPKKHSQPPTTYRAKTCIDCGSEFECPGNWRRTQRCPDCAETYNRYAQQVRQESKELLLESGRPMICEVCGSSVLPEIHHDTPIVKGGGSELKNLKVLCILHHSESHRGKIAR